MNKTLRTLGTTLMMAITLHASATSLAAQTATQTVTFSVVAASRASFAGAAWTAKPAAGIGRAASSASVGASSYSIETNEVNQKIVASLNSALPTGVTLAVSLDAPKGAVSVGARSLGRDGKDVVTGISTLGASQLPIAYTMDAKADTRASAKAPSVTFTITAGL